MLGLKRVEHGYVVGYREFGGVVYSKMYDSLIMLAKNQSIKS